MKTLGVLVGVLGVLAVAALSPAVSVLVAPVSGPTTTIEAAVAAVNAGADTSNTITLRSTEGPIILPTNTTWTFLDGKSCDFVAESGQPIVRLSQASSRYMLTVGRTTNVNQPSDFYTFTGIAFIPPTGLAYASNVGDGLSCASGNFIFTNCVFSSNNGTNGVASQEGAAAFVDNPTGNNVGDDWLQFNTAGDATLHHCTVTGAADDAVILIGAASPVVALFTADQGTCIANNGGAGIQVAYSQVASLLDGTAGRVQLVKSGLRSASNDTGIKIFSAIDNGITIIKTDICDNNLGNIVDYNGLVSLNITDSRIAFGNAGDQSGASNLSFIATGVTGLNQPVNITRSTIHDALGATFADGAVASQAADNGLQIYTIIDSIFSGANDTFANMTNKLSTPVSPAVVKTFTAVVTNGAHAVANAGDLGTGSVNADPAYVSVTYTIGRSQDNPNFLMPSSASYAGQSSTGTFLKGGTPGTPASVTDWSVF